jgi:hypothetical protein
MCTKAEPSAEVVIGPPRFDFPPGILDRQELIGVETFIAQLAIEGLVRLEDAAISPSLA